MMSYFVHFKFFQSTNKVSDKLKHLLSRRSFLALGIFKHFCDCNYDNETFHRGGAVMLRNSWTEADDKSFLTNILNRNHLIMPRPIFLLERIISTRTHFNCFAGSLKMSKQSRITFSLNLNVNLFLTRVFSIYIQFCSSSLPAICALRPLPT